MKRLLLIVCMLAFAFNGYSQNQIVRIVNKDIYANDVKVGAERTNIYYNLLQGKNVAIVANQTSYIKNTHIVDSLLSDGINIKKVFALEHGFRGGIEAGEEFENGIDKKTQLPIVSLYGKHRKPNEKDLKDIDVVVFDIQDVGVRCYTYLSSMVYMMEACAENNVLFIILDRPNPNGHYVDGPVLEEEFSSFVGLNKVPLVYGMTLAEYALMVNNEGWLKDGKQCRMRYVRVKNYQHNNIYHMPIIPSPNLPNMASVVLYPSLVLFEATDVSIGRGTDMPFQVVGHPDLKTGDFSFTPKPIAGKAEDPKHNGQECKGYSLREFAMRFIKTQKQINLVWLIDTYKELNEETEFFTSESFFDKLAGTDKLRKMIIEGKTEKEIRDSWEADIIEFKSIRRKYLLYTDFQ